MSAWWKRIRSGESGALPILAGLVLIIVIFESQQSKFLSSLNIVNLLVQAAFFILLGAAEIFALLLSEIDLSVGYVAAVGGAIIAALISPPYNWPWWAGVIVGLLASAALGALQGTLITRLHLPSFVVTLAGLLGFSGVLIFVFDVDKGSVGRRDQHQQQRRLQPRQRKHEPGRQLDHPGGPGGAVCRRRHPARPPGDGRAASAPRP